MPFNLCVCVRVCDMYVIIFYWLNWLSDTVSLLTLFMFSQGIYIDLVIQKCDVVVLKSVLIVKKKGIEQHCM